LDFLRTSQSDRRSRHTSKPTVKSGAPVWVRSDIRPHTAQTQNKRTSTESNLVTAQSTAYEPPEDGHKYVLKHVGATLLKCF
jgi:hypothetical protein